MDKDAVAPVSYTHLDVYKRQVLCVCIGYPVAYAIAQASPKKRNLLILLVTLPMWINMLVRTYAWIGILADNGLINHILAFFGLEPTKLLYTDFAVVLGMVYNFIPFMILQIESSLAKMDKSLLEAANDLGANRFQRFKNITFPLSLPGVVSGITLVFLPSVSSFVIPKLMGGGGYMMIGNVIENQFITVGEWNFGSAISMIMAVIIMISMYTVSYTHLDVYKRQVLMIRSTSLEKSAWPGVSTILIFTPS